MARMCILLQDTCSGDSGGPLWTNSKKKDSKVWILSDTWLYLTRDAAGNPILGVPGRFSATRSQENIICLSLIPCFPDTITRVPQGRGGGTRGGGSSPCSFSVYSPEKRILISGKNKGRDCWANQSWPTSLWQNESSCYLYADQSPFKMDKDYNHQLFTNFIYQKWCHAFLVCSLDKCNNSILYSLAIKCFEFCFISLVTVVYRIGVSIISFSYSRLDHQEYIIDYFVSPGCLSIPVF